MIRKYILLFLSVCLSVALHAQTADQIYAQAQKAFDAKNYKECLKQLDRVNKIDPNYANAFFLAGLTYTAMKDYRWAIEEYNAFIKLVPNDPGAFYNRGYNYNELRKFDSAWYDYDQAIRLNPNEAAFYYARGACYANFSEYDSAILDYTRNITLAPTNPAGYVGRGNVYILKGNYDKSIADFYKSTELDINRTSPFAAVNILEPLLRMEKFAEAAKAYEFYKQNYKGSYLDMKNLAYYKKFIEVAVQFLPVKDYTRAWNGFVEAENLYNTVVGNGTTEVYESRRYGTILAMMGYVAEKLNDTETALQVYNQAMVLNKNQPEINAAIDRLTKKKEIVAQNDNTDPVIKMLEPAPTRAIGVDDDKPVGVSQRLRGQVIDPGGIKSIRINNKPVKFEENGYFDTVVTIGAGVNVFTIVATDRQANTVSETVQINSAKDKPASAPNKPAVTIDYSPVYHAIFIAETEYSDPKIPSLNGPVLDMRKVYNTLTTNYNFLPQNTDTLVNAPRSAILDAIINKANSLGENDNLFIFYAGHGELVKQPDNSEEGFLVPVDARKNSFTSYISSDDLMRTIKYSKARHILFVADACFAGSLFREIQKDAPLMVAEAYKDKSRKLLASGNRTVVPDQSEFIEYFRLALQENREKYITAEQLIDSFKNQYREATKLLLQYFPIKNVEDFGGQFVFKRK